MFKLVYRESPSRNVVHLLAPTPKARALAVESVIKKACTRAAIWAAMNEAQVYSSYALEAKVAEIRGLHFDNTNKSRTFEALIRDGSPAIEEVESWPIANRKTLETLAVFDHFVQPLRTIQLPIWKLLRAEIPSKKWLNQTMRDCALASPLEKAITLLPPRDASRVLMVIFGEISGDDALRVLTRTLVAFRLAEAEGDLPRFIALMMVLKSVRFPQEPAERLKGPFQPCQPVLRALREELSCYMQSVFAHVRLVGRSSHGIAIARARLNKENISLQEIVRERNAFPNDDAEFVAEPLWSLSTV